MARFITSKSKYMYISLIMLFLIHLKISHQNNNNFGKHVYFEETFNSEEIFSQRWVISKSSSSSDPLTAYNGTWALQEISKNLTNINNALSMKSNHSFYAISAPLFKTIEFDTALLVIQYHIKFPPKFSCGGAYIKLISKNEINTDLSQFNDKSPFTIMFGPDKCGHENKIHFIFRYRNPITNEYSEKNVKPINYNSFKTIFIDNEFHLWKLIIKNDNSFEISLDKIIILSGSLNTHFDPPITPPEYINDPEDVKPQDWDDVEMIPDPEAQKPADWEIKNPLKIPDESAKNPDHSEENDQKNSLSDANNCIGDTCVKWAPPLIPNPNYKEWKAPLIKNPKYMGIYKKRLIKNPNYFIDKEPFKMTPIVAVGIEVMSADEGVMFDNIFITSDLAAAEIFDSVTWALKWHRKFFDYVLKIIISPSFPYTAFVLFLSVLGLIFYVKFRSHDATTDVSVENQTDVSKETLPIKEPITESDEDPMKELNIRKGTYNKS